MPWTVALPLPVEPACTSLWYQDTPNGAVGCWITNRSKPVPAGMPLTVTFMMSLRRPVVIVRGRLAWGRQGERAGEEGFSWKENVWPALAWAPAPSVVPAAAVRPAARATAPAAAVTASVRRNRRPVSLL